MSKPKKEDFFMKPKCKS